MIAAVRDKREPRTVRRPARVADFAAHREQLFAWSGSVDRRGPDLATFDERDHFAARRNDGLIAVGNGFRIAAVERHAEDLDLGRRRIRADVYRERVIPIRPVIAAANVDDPSSVRRHRDAAQLLPVIPVVVRELARRERGPFGDEDVAPALLVERPCDALPPSAGAGGQLGRVRVGTHLLQREPRRARGLSNRGRRKHAESRCEDCAAHETS